MTHRTLDHPTTRLRGKIPGLLIILALGTMSLLEAANAGTISGQVTATKAKYRVNVVVYIDSIPGRTFAAPEQHVLMDQKGLAFIPHVLPVVSGTTVDFRNSDSVLHNVFTPDEVGDKFNLGSWPQGEMRSHTFTKSCETACDAVMLCNVHPEMEAFVIVLSNPYFAVTDDEGNFTIPDVPAGSYTVRTWHERLKEASQKVSVGKSDSVRVNLTLER